MKKEEFDSIVEVYSDRIVPNKEVIDHSDNKLWWTSCSHSDDIDDKKKESMYLHRIAFNGTIAIACKEIKKNKQNIYNNKNFVSKYKQVKN